MVSNGLGSSVTSSTATLTVLATDPAFILQPQNFRTNYGGTAAFSAQALGSGTISYRWQSNGVDMADGPTGSGSSVSGATSATLTISGVSYRDAVAYSVNATNGLGASFGSSSATLTVNDPYVPIPPASRTNVVGTSASFSVTAAGSPSLAYAWSRNGAPLSNGGPISGADTATLSISAVSNVDGGTYLCTVGGGSGSTADSAAATLKVLSANPGEFLYWDGNADASGAGTAPQATWGSANFWSVDSGGTVPTGVWMDGATAVFSAGTDTAGNIYNVTVSGNQPVQGITFEEGNVTLAGGTITMVGGGGRSEFNAAGGLLDVINTTVVAGTNDFVKTGDGGLRLNGNPNTYTGKTILRGGTLTSANESRFGAVPGALVADNVKFDGGTLEWVPTGNQALSATRGVTITSNGGTINVDNTGTLSIGGPMTGPGALTVQATVNTGNAFISSGSNSFTGGFTNASAGITTTFQGPSMYLPGSFTVNDGTVVVANGSNTIGPITLNGGQLRPNATPNALGSAVVTVNGGTIRTTAAGTGSTVVSNNIVVNPSIADQFAASALGVPSVATGGGGSQFGIEYAGVISGPGGLLRNDTGDKDFILSGANTFSGGFTMVDYYINPANKSAFGTGTIAIGDPIWNGGHPTTSSGNIHDMRIDPLVPLTGASAITNPLVIHYQLSLTIKITTNALEFSGPIEIGDAIEPSGINSSSLPTTTGLTPIYANSSGLTHTFSGVISSSVGRGLEVRGNGARLQLTAANTYPGGTIVSDNPTLAVNNTSGSGTGPGFVLVRSATLVGTGTIAGPVTNLPAGTISGGSAKSAVGKLTMQSGLDMSAGGTNAWELGVLKDDSTGVAGSDFDQLAISGGNLNLGSPATLALGFLAPASAPSVTNAFWRTTHNWTVIKLSGGAVNTGSAFGTIFTPASGAGVFSNSVSGAGVLLTFTPTPAPTITSITRAGAGATISWTAANLANYQLQYKTNLTQANWLVLSNLTGAGTVVSVTDNTGGDPQRFYRVALTP
jgi:autotransporter-associated beta strand protein